MSLELKKINHYSKYTLQDINDIKAFVNSKNTNNPVYPNGLNTRQKTRFRQKFGTHFTTSSDDKLFYYPNRNLRIEVIEPERREEALRSIYNDPEKGLGVGLKQFYYIVCRQYIGITREMTSAFLKKQGDYNLTIPYKRAVNKPILSITPNERWGIDMIDMNFFRFDRDENEQQAANIVGGAGRERRTRTPNSRFEGFEITQTVRRPRRVVLPEPNIEPIIEQIVEQPVEEQQIEQPEQQVEQVIEPNEIELQPNRPRNGRIGQREFILPVNHNRGYRYILTVVDYFSKKVFAKPLKNRSLQHVIENLNAICQENETYPHTIQTDNEFNKPLFRDWCENNNITRITITSYTPNSNGLVERMNKEIWKKLRAGFVRFNSLEWVQHLQQYVNNINNQR